MELDISENSRKVLERRYLKKGPAGDVIETPEGMFRRVAQAIAAADKIYGYNLNEIACTEESFYQMMINLEFVPNSPTLMNAGRPLGQLSACFVLPIHDSMESIFDTLKAAAIIHKSGGGTGFSFSSLREKNSLVQATGGVASGPVSFMKVFDAATQAVKQGGMRRGANMGILRIDHPDILEFITCKEKDKEISNFNISIAVTDKFWQALDKGEDYDLISPLTKKVVKRLNSRMVFDLIVKSAHRNGEPGVIFIDRMNEFNPTPQLGPYEATNPCGEQVLLPYESCNLGSINLIRMVKRTADGYDVDWDKLQSTVRKAVHFLDNVIDANRHPIKEIEEKTKLTRKIGLGVMGWASMLLRLGVAYDSQQAIDLAERVMSFILTEAKIKSLELGKTKGLFPAFEKSVYADGGEKMGFRNATLTTIAPTGTISIIAGPCSSGIEPIFSISYYRSVMDKTKLVEVDRVFEDVARERGFYSQELMEKIASEGGIQKMENIPEDIKRIFVTAHDISPEWHVKMQAAFQKYTDNAISKTINFPHVATEEDVAQAFLLAYRSGCKGITVYRDGSREDQVLNVSKKEEEVCPAEDPGHLEPRPRPEVTVGTTTKELTGCGNLYVTINDDKDGRPFEVFTQMGKAGGCAASQLEAIARLTSLALRSGIDPKAVAEQLRGIRCPAPAWNKGNRIFSCADAISQVLEKRAQDSRKEQVAVPSMVMAAEKNKAEPLKARDQKNVVGVCVDCGSPLHHEEGCIKCYGCGFTKC